MSLPTKEEVLGKAHSLGFAERVKFGAKLGHQQASNASLSTLLKDVRTYEPVESPQLDAASVQVSSFLPTQQLHGAKHFDVEQVALAAATAAKKRDVLEAEVRGPNAANLTYACDRLVGMTGKDEKSVKYLFDLLIQLPEKRKKPFLKALVKHQNVATLDRYVDHIKDAKDLPKQLVPFLHGCSRSVIVTHLSSLWAHNLKANILHLARYRADALLDVFEAGLARCTEPQQFAPEWSTCQVRLSVGLGIMVDQKPIAARFLALMVKYPPQVKHWEVYYNTAPQILLTHWQVFTKYHYEPMMKFVMSCVRPHHGGMVFTVYFGQHLIKRRQLFELLEATVPKSIDTQVPEYEQLSVPEVFSHACQIFSKLKFLPDILEHAKKLLDWAQRYSAKYPALAKSPASLFPTIFTNALNSITAIQSQLSQKVQQKKLEALEKLRIEGKKSSELDAKLIGKQIDNKHTDKAILDLFNLFLPVFQSFIAAAHKKCNVAKPTHQQEEQVTKAISLLSTLAYTCPSHLPVILKLEELWKAYTWTYPNFNNQWQSPESQIFELYRTNAANGLTNNAHFELLHSPAQVSLFREHAKTALKHCFDMVSSNPNLYMSYIDTVIKMIGQIGWEAVSPFFQLFKLDHFKENIKEGKEDTVISILSHVPLAERQTIVNALLEPKVCTPSQRQKLQQLLAISDPKTRKMFEQATSSSSPGERAAGIIRMVNATKSLPFTREGRNFAQHLASPSQCADILKEGTATLAFVAKRIKNATFQDRVIIQNLSFLKEDFSTVWLAPGVGPAQFAIWLEMLDDHLQNPNQVLGHVEIEEPESYSSALADFGFNQWGNEALSMWDALTWASVFLGVSRNDDPLLEFGYNLAAKVGTAQSGAGDPLGTRINYQKLAGYLITLRDPARTTAIIEKLSVLVQKHCVEAQLKPLKVSNLLRSLISGIPVTHLQFFPTLEKYVRDQYEKELAQVKPILITDILKPPTLPTGFEDEAELEAIAMGNLIPTLVARSMKSAWRVPILVDWIFKVALKSWAAAEYVDVAFRVRLQTAFHAHRVAFKGPDAEYRKPQGAALRKFEMDISGKFARELLDISPSALHLPRIQRIFAQIDPSVLFSHITSETRNIDDIADEKEKLEAMEKAALLGPFTRLSIASGAGHVVVGATRAARPARGRGGRGGRGGRARGRGRPMARVIPSRIVAAPSTAGMQSAIVSQLSLVRDITKKWRRGQSQKSNDNTAFFMPTLCYGMKAWHSAQILSLGKGIASALMNPMRSLAAQKKFAILWSLLPTTTYGDIVIFLQQNDYNFFPEDPSAVSAEDEEGDDKEKKPIEDNSKKAQLPLAVVETMIRGVTMNDEPLAPLAFLLSPTFLSSNYSRTAIAAVQALMPYVPGGLLTNALAYLLKEHRSTLKITAHKQIIRFLSEHVCVEHWDIFVSEWKHPKTHRDVRITLLQIAFQTLSISSGEIQERVWELLELAVQHKEAEVVCALLKTLPNPATRRLPPFDLAQNALLNNRVKNQYNSYTTINIPADCSARYMKTIIMPLLKLEQGINGSDLQFLAYYTLRFWSGFLNTSNPGAPDISAFSSVLVRFLKDSLISGALWESRKKKEEEAAVQRWSWAAGTLTWLLCLHPSNPNRDSIIADANLQPSDYDFADKAQVIADLTSWLVKRLETFEKPALITPEDEVKFKSYANTCCALDHLIREHLDASCVKKRNATVDEQESWLAPIRNSSMSSSFDTVFLTVKIDQTPVNVASSIDDFMSLFHDVVIEAAANRHLRAQAYTGLQNWLSSQSLYAIETKYIKRMLGDFKERNAKWSNAMEKTLDIAWTFNLCRHALNSSSFHNLQQTLTLWTDFIEVLLKVHAGLEPLISGPGIAPMFPNLVSDIANVFSQLMYDYYDSVKATRKRFLNWLIDRALENIKKYSKESKLSNAESDYVKLWRQLLGYYSGSNLAQFVPTRVGEILDAIAHEEPISNKVREILDFWLSPTSLIVDPSLAGVGIAGIDHQYAVKLVTDLLELTLVKEDPNFPRGPRYFTYVMQAIVNLFTLNKMSDILFKNASKIWWQGINLVYAYEFLANANPAFALQSYFSVTYTLPVTTGKTSYDSTDMAIIKSAMDHIEDLHNGKGVALGIPTDWMTLYPFHLVQDDLYDHCKSVAMSLAAQLGENTALLPPKGTGSSLAVWIPEVRQFLTKLSASTPDKHRIIKFVMASLDYRMHPVPVETPEAKSSK